MEEGSSEGMGCTPPAMFPRKPTVRGSDIWSSLTVPKATPPEEGRSEAPSPGLLHIVRSSQSTEQSPAVSPVNWDQKLLVAGVCLKAIVWVTCPLRLSPLSLVVERQRGTC